MKETFISGTVGILFLTLTGCGVTANNTATPDIANTTNTTINNRVAGHATANTITGTTATKAIVTMTTVSATLAHGQSISFKVPAQWIKRHVAVGDTFGSVWINPGNPQQEIDIITSYNIGAIKNYSTNQWDVTEMFGRGTKIIQWANVASDKTSGNFTNTSKLNPWAKNESTPYTGCGKAFVITKPPQFGVFVEVWGPRIFAKAVLQTVQIQH